MLKRIFLCSILGASTLGFAQEVEDLMESDTIQLSAVQAMAELPITSEKITHRTLREKGLGQDLPILLKNATSVVSASDAGNGIGYTSMRVRGIDQNQMNMTFNGVPVNDSESHGIFWVNFPDVASSAQDVLIQRGVGTSSNGAAAFGGSVNLETNSRKRNPYGELEAAYGSFNTMKYGLNAGTGDFADGKFNVDTRLSYIQTDGYIDRASSDLFSGALNAYYRPNNKTEFQVLNLFGAQKTYQAWYGIDGQTMEDDRTHNPAGAIYDENGNVVDYFDNQTDNYVQNHLHTYWRQKWNDTWRSTATLHWTRGKGYYEEYKQDATLSNYWLASEDEADLIRRQYLDNHFFGGVFNLEAKNLNDFDLYFGAALNHYIGGHYGTVEDLVDSDVNFADGHRYYENESLKTEFSSYAKANYTINNIELFGDVQFRTINYDADYKNGGDNSFKDFIPYDFSWTFVNPKAGITYRMPQSRMYLSYGLTHREPTRSDILANLDKVKPETLHDFELGFRTQNWLNFGVNVFYMYYLDQLVLTGQIDDVGNPVRENVGESFRSGVELDFSKRVLQNKVNLFGNFAYNHSRNLDYQLLKDDGTIVDMGSTKIAYTPEIVTSFGLDVYPIGNLKLNLTNKYVSEQFITNFEAQDGLLDSYYVADFLANYNLKLNKNNLSLTLMVNNIFDKLYVNNAYYAGEPYYFPQAGRNFMIGAKFGF